MFLHTSYFFIISISWVLFEHLQSLCNKVHKNTQSQSGRVHTSKKMVLTCRNECRKSGNTCTQKKRATRNTFIALTQAPIHLKFLNWAKTLDDISELLKQPGQQWKRKLHSKSESLVLQTSLLLFSLVQFVKCSWIFLELNHKGLYQNAEEEKRSLKPPKNVKFGGFTSYSCQEM